MTLQGLLDETRSLLAGGRLDDPGFEARQLVQEALDLTFAQIVAGPDRAISADEINKVRAWARRRAGGEPLAYLSGARGFYKNDFLVAPGVLIPRPETELVVETALRRLDDEPLGPVHHLADLGCGSGCIGLSLLLELSAARLLAIDASDVAVDVTTKNARRLGLLDRVDVTHARVETVKPGAHFELIVANPPYIAEGDPLVEENVRKFEPALALFAGDEGRAALKEFAAWAHRNLVPGGLFVCEFGAGQTRHVEDILAALDFRGVQIERDLAGHDRVISARRARSE